MSITFNFSAQTRRLTFSYLLVIMTISILFSGIILAITANNFNRPIPPHERQKFEISDDFIKNLHQRDEKTVGAIIISLVQLNGMVLMLGLVLSYLLARKTLDPIEKNIEQQEEFIANASHELRTPLTSMNLNNELLLRKKVLDPLRAKQAFKQNIDDIKMMNELIESLLQLSMPRQQVEKTEVLIDDFLKNIIGNYNLLASDKNIEFKVEAPNIKRMIFEDQIRQVLKILIDNALKYSDNNGVINISYRKGEWAVQDFGVGIPLDKQPYIFDRFYQVDLARTRTIQQGNGLGLSIAKKIADEYKFKLSVKSEPMKGTTFTLKT